MFWSIRGDENYPICYCNHAQQTNFSLFPSFLVLFPFFPPSLSPSYTHTRKYHNKACHFNSYKVVQEGRNSSESVLFFQIVILHINFDLNARSLTWNWLSKQQNMHKAGQDQKINVRTKIKKEKSFRKGQEVRSINHSFLTWIKLSKVTEQYCYLGKGFIINKSFLIK